MRKQQLTFIEKKYLPWGMEIAQARSLKLEELVSIFSHIGQRQEMYGAKDVFRFKSIMKKNMGILPAKYPDAVDVPENESDADAGNKGRPDTGATSKRPRRRTRGKKSRAKPVAHNAELDAEQEPNEGDASVDGDPQQGMQAAYILVGQDIATQMRTVGFKIPPPCNGPAEGTPQYSIPRDLYEEFVQQTTASSSKAPSHANNVRCIDPRLLNAELPTPRPSPMPSMSPAPTPTPIVNATRIQPTRRGKGRQY